MPPVAGAVASAVIAGSTISAGVLTVGFSVTAFAGSLVLGGISYALTPKAKKPSVINGGEIASNTVTVRQSDLTRQHVFGHTRITRGLAHMEVTGVNNKLHIMVLLCQGELRAITEIWMDDYAMPMDWFDANGNCTEGRYTGKLRVFAHLGAAGQDADPIAVAQVPGWSSDHKLSGIAYLYVTLTKDQDIYPNGVPNISAVVEGPTVYDPRTDSQVWTTNIALYSHKFLRDSEFGFAVLPDDVDLTNIAAQANICDEMVDIDSDMPDAVHDVAFIETAIDTFRVGGNVLKFQYGDRVQVTSTGTLPGGISPTTDYYVIPYLTKRVPRLRLASSFENALNKIYIDITSTGSGTIKIVKNAEPRYHGSGIIDTETNLRETLNNLVSSMAGRAVCIGGFWTLLAGAWRSPAQSFGIGDIRSTMGFKNALSLSESFNVVKGLFISSLNTYQMSDYPSARYIQFIEDDNGIEDTKELNLPFTNRATTAQRIAKIELFRGRQDISFKADFDVGAIAVQPGDNISLKIDRYGWNEKVFEITDFTFDVANGSVVTRLSLRETAQAIFDWSQGEAIVYDPAPNSELPNPFDVSPVTGVAYSSREVDTRDGDIIYALVLSWDQNPDLFVTEFGDFEIQFKKSADPDWRPSFFVDGSLTRSDILNSSVNIPYDLRIRARNNLGVRSAWSVIEGAVVGSSGGVGTTLDWGFVYESVSVYNDWGNVYDSPTAFNDWGNVT